MDTCVHDREFEFDVLYCDTFNFAGSYNDANSIVCSTLWFWQYGMISKFQSGLLYL